MLSRNGFALARMIRIATVFAIAGLCAACFQPLYGEKTLTGAPNPLRSQLASIDIGRIDAPNGTPESRVAVELQNALHFELTGGSGTLSPTHQLRVLMSTNRSAIIVDALTGRVEAEITGINASYALVELASGKTILSGSTFSRVSSDYPGQEQRFARARARLNAEDRAAKVVAENIRTRLASFLATRT